MKGGVCLRTNQLNLRFIIITISWGNVQIHKWAKALIQKHWHEFQFSLLCRICQQKTKKQILGRFLLHFFSVF